MDEESIVKENLLEKNKNELVELLRDNLLESNFGVVIISIILLSSTWLMWHTRGTIIPVIVILIPIIIFAILIDARLVVTIYLYIENIVYNIIVSPYYLFKILCCNKYCCYCCNKKNKTNTNRPSSSSSGCFNCCRNCLGSFKSCFVSCFVRTYGFFYYFFCCTCCRNNNNENKKDSTIIVEENTKEAKKKKSTTNNTSRKQNQIHPKTLPPSKSNTTVSKGPSFVDQLISLSKLKAEGLLTEDEFVLAKQKILKGSKSD